MLDKLNITERVNAAKELLRSTKDPSEALHIKRRLIELEEDELLHEFEEMLK